MNSKSTVSFKLSTGFLILWVFVALLAPFLANEKPILGKINSDLQFFPITINQEYTSIIPSLIPYSAETIDLNNSNSVGPFDYQDVKSTYFRHWLGTDELGRDVLANLIHGSKTALLVGLGAMFLAGLIGIFLGSISAFFGDNRISMSRFEFYLLLLSFLLYLLLISTSIPWDVQAVSLNHKIGLLLSISSIFISFFLLVKYYSKSSKKKRSIKIPLDLIIGRLIEVMESIPLLFLVIALSALLNPSIITIILIIGVAAWTGIARYVRAETLKIMQLNYVESGKALGFSNPKIIFKHILPNALGPVLISLSFGIAAAIMIEATLSFIGMGLSSSEASWGQLIAEARSNYKAWWLAIFPGLAIFFTVLSCNVLGDQLQKK